MAPHSSILAWKILWVEDPGGLQFMGPKRVRYDWAAEHNTSRKPWNIILVYIRPSSPTFSDFLVQTGLFQFIELALSCIFWGENTGSQQLRRKIRDGFPSVPAFAITRMTVGKSPYLSKPVSSSVKWDCTDSDFTGSVQRGDAQSETVHSVSVQLLSCIQLFATPWTAACQAFLSITNSHSLLKVMSIELVMSSHNLILCHPLLLLSSNFPIIRVFSNESALHIR